MPARTKQQIVDDAKAIAKAFSVQPEAGEHAGAASNTSTESMTWEQAMIRLQLLQIELLSNIRQSETNP